MGGMDCSENIECLSGACLNDKCKKASLSQNVEASKDEMFGDDSDTNNMIALTFMIVIAGGIAIGIHSIMGAVVGALVFVVLGIFFTIIGWLSVFILFGIFIVIIISGVFMLLLSGGG